MTMLVCMPLQDVYVKINDVVYEVIQDPDAPPQADNVEAAADSLVDTILTVMIAEVIETVEMKPFAKKIITQVEKVIEKTAHVLIHKVILKLDNEQLWPLVEYLHDMEVEMEGQRYLSFELHDASERAMKQAHIDIENGNLESAKDNLHLALQDLLDLGLLYFYKNMMDMIELGAIARKIVDFGYTTIHKVTKPAINKIVHGMDMHELESLKNYIDKLVFEIE